MHPSIPVFLCSKAAQLGATGVRAESRQVFTVNSSYPPVYKFQELYAARTGTTPSWAANKMYEAVHTVAAALRTTGSNRVLLRDYLAGEGKSREAASAMPFDPAGNSLQEFAIVQLQSTATVKP
jgi:ABC-type branched-subunit amino acid transport system substrate-binding protein